MKHPKRQITQATFDKLAKLNESFISQADIERVRNQVNCRRCSRTLTDPESIKLGIGPECIQAESTERLEVSLLKPQAE